MKKIFTVSTIVLSLFLSGCLAHMRAANIADNFNAQAGREGNPYRWYVIDLEGDKAKLEQKLDGEVGATKITDSKKQAILAKVEQLEMASGRTTKPQLKEIRILPRRSLTNQLLASVNNRLFEAWVFDSTGKEIVYTVDYVPGSEDQEIIKGPWSKRS
jgi:hypothetical protein